MQHVSHQYIVHPRRMIYIVSPGLSDRQGTMHAWFPYKFSKLVNADMDDEMVPVMLL